MPIERREFFLLVGSATVGVGLAGCTSARQVAEPPASSAPRSSATRPSPTASPHNDASTPPNTQLGPQVVHGPRDRPQVALTFHGQGPVPIAEALLGEAEQAGALISVLAVGTWLVQYPQMARRILSCWFCARKWGGAAAAEP